jgi:hypothetical protein
MLKFFVIIVILSFAYNYLILQQNETTMLELKESTITNKDIVNLMNVPLATPNPVREVFNTTENLYKSSENETINNTIQLNETIKLNESNTTINNTEVIIYNYNTKKLNSKILLEQERSIAKINENFGIIMFYMCDYGVYPNPNLPNKTSSIMFGLADTYKLILTEMC